MTQRVPEHFFSQFYAGMATALVVVDRFDAVLKKDGLFEAIVGHAPDLGELIQASERIGEYKLTGRLRRLQMKKNEASPR